MRELLENPRLARNVKWDKPRKGRLPIKRSVDWENPRGPWPPAEGRQWENSREPWPSLEAPREPYKYAEGVSNGKILENPARRLKDSIERTVENLGPPEGRPSGRIRELADRRNVKWENPRKPWPPAKGRSSERILQNPGSRLKEDQVRESYRTLAAGWRTVKWENPTEPWPTAEGRSSERILYTTLAAGWRTVEWQNPTEPWPPAEVRSSDRIL